MVPVATVPVATVAMTVVTVFVPVAVLTVMRLVERDRGGAAVGGCGGRVGGDGRSAQRSCRDDNDNGNSSRNTRHSFAPAVAIMHVRTTLSFRRCPE